MQDDKNVYHTTVIGIDPGTKTGVATGIYLPPKSPRFVAHKQATGHHLYNLAANKPTKKHAGEPWWVRPGKLYALLTEQVAFSLPSLSAERLLIVCEGATGFERGKAAVRVGHELRGAVQAFAYALGATYCEVSPTDLKRFATGRGNADKTDMVKAANDKYGLTTVTDDNVADALHLMHYGLEMLDNGLIANLINEDNQ